MFVRYLPEGSEHLTYCFDSKALKSCWILLNFHCMAYSARCIQKYRSVMNKLLCDGKPNLVVTSYIELHVHGSYLSPTLCK